MRVSRGVAAAVVAGLGILCAAPGAFAQEGGSFSAVANYVRDFTSIEHADGTYFGGTLEGSTTTVASSGEPFVAGGNSLSTCVVFGKRAATGLDLQTRVHDHQRIRRHALSHHREAGGRRGRGRRRRGTDRNCGRHRRLCRGDRNLHLRNQLPGERSGRHADGLHLAQGVTASLRGRRRAGLRRRGQSAPLRLEVGS